MVKVKDFYGAVFHPEEYQTILNNNIEHLESIPMSKTFNTAEMIASGRLQPETTPFFYIYRQHYLSHTSYGILAQISLEDYHNNKIKKHEKTLHRPGLNHKTYLQDHVGPVVVSHREDESLNEMILALTSRAAFSQWNTSDGRQHALWKIREDEADLESRFAGIEALYILDGHHRLEAAHQNYLLAGEKSESDLWIQAIIYSSEYIMVHPQHRVLQNIPENMQIINELMGMEHLEMTELVADEHANINAAEELIKYEVMLKLHEKFYGINFRNHSRNVLEKVTTVRLQNEIFTGFTEDVLKKLKYVPGIIDQQEIYQHEIVFFVRQPAIETLFQIADESVTMPPKSTWIEPKPCSHMVIRLFV